MYVFIALNYYLITHVGFEVFMTVTMENAVLLHVTLCETCKN
jgi:hypothetical protein